MSRDRFGLLERHSAVHWWFRSLVASPPVRHLLLCAKHLFVETMVQKLLPLGSGEAETGDPRGRDGGVREELAAGVVQLKPTTKVEAAP